MPPAAPASRHPRAARGADHDRQPTGPDWPDRRRPRAVSPRAKIPDGFRVGYAEYLRAATTSDILAAALPGAAGIAGFTVLGAYAGYRQAKAIQQALLAPVPTSVLL